ncbi:MAG: acyl-CoA N-acyltransferase [Monoraphidium minutum]|nr:MAG: acyl-CoA N-acyltransferase [Monoraphidium minutum]
MQASLGSPAAAGRRPRTSARAQGSVASSFGGCRSVMRRDGRRLGSGRRSLAVRAAADGISGGKVAWAEQLPGGAAPPPAVTKGNAEFLDLGVEFLSGRDGIDLAELNELFEKVGFPRREPALLQVALDNTHRIVWVRSCKQSRVARMGQLLGFARATSDGVFNATIWDVAVAPAWQRSGLGRALMERLTAALVADGIPTISLYAEPKVVGLYKKLGFQSDVQGIKGMAFQRRKGSGADAQKGRPAAAGSRR